MLEVFSSTWIRVFLFDFGRSQTAIVLLGSSQEAQNIP